MLLIDVVTKGGWLMIPIAICSVFALGIILERLVSYSRIKGNIQKITQQPLQEFKTSMIFCMEASQRVTQYC